MIWKIKNPKNGDRENIALKLKELAIKLKGVRGAITIFVLCLLLNVQTVLAQGVAINADNSAPDASAMLDVKSTDKGMLVPRLTTIQKNSISSPATGLLVFDTDLACFCYYNGTIWLALTASTMDGLTDADGDTKVQVEETADDDHIRFDVNGTEAMIIDDNGFVGIGVTPATTFGVDMGVSSTASLTASCIPATSSAGLNTPAWQSFTAVRDGDLSHVSLRISNTPADTLKTISIYKGEGTSGTLLYTGSPVSVNVSGATWVDFPVSGVSIEAWKKYTISVNNRQRWSLSNTDPYTGGISGNGSNIDYNFLVYAFFAESFSVHNSGVTISEYTLPKTDGSSGQVLQTNGAGTISWSDAAISAELADADGDTKIELEKTADEDIIHFDLAGTEYFRMDQGRLEVLNTGASVYVGENAGASNTSGQFNNGIGSAVLNYNTTGSYNAALGSRALYNNTNGNNNVALGPEAGYNATGDGNIFIGYQAGQNETGSDKLYINNNNNDEPLIYGDFATDTLRVNGHLSVNGHYHFPNYLGANNQVLRIDDSGKFGWSDMDISDRNGDTRIDLDNGENDDQIVFTIENSQAMILDSLGHVAIGDFDPQAALDIYDKDGNNILLVNTRNNVSNGDHLGGIGFGSKDGGRPEQVVRSGAAIIALAAQGHTATDKGTHLTFLTSPDGKNIHVDATERMRIRENGNVGIGISNAQELLHVAGSIRMEDGNEQNGFIMVSDADGTGAWADPASVFGDQQDLILSGDTLSLTNDSTSVDLSVYLDNTDQQDLSLSSNILSITNDTTTVDLSPYLDDTDDQTLSLSGNDLSITDGNTITLPLDAEIEDTDGDTKIQVEETADDDIIRFNVEGNEIAILIDENDDFDKISGTNNPRGILSLIDYGLLLKRSGTGNQVITIEGSYGGAAHPFARIDFRNNDNTLYTGASIRSHNNGASEDGDLRFLVASDTILSEAMRIEPSGDVWINGELDMVSNEIVDFDRLAGNSTSSLRIGHTVTSNQSRNLISDTDVTPNNATGDEDLYIGDDLEVNGDAYKPGGGSFSTTSDKRLKRDILPFTDGLSQVMQIKPIKFKYIEGWGELNDPNREFIGILAQDMQQIAPYMVEEVAMRQEIIEHEDGTEEIIDEGEKYLTYDPSALDYLLVNGMQEQQAEIKTLKAEVEALKALVIRISEQNKTEIDKK